MLREKVKNLAWKKITWTTNPWAREREERAKEKEKEEERAKAKANEERERVKEGEGGFKPTIEGNHKTRG